MRANGNCTSIIANYFHFCMLYTCQAIMVMLYFECHVLWHQQFVIFGHNSIGFVAGGIVMNTNIQFLYNTLDAGFSDFSFAKTICKHIETSQDLMFAVAFVSDKGLSMIWQDFETFIKTGGNAEIILGLDGKITEPKAIHRLYELSSKYPKFELFGVPSKELNVLYHPKMYFFTGYGKGSFIIGSSNLTSGGFKNNFEANVQLEADDTCEEFWDALDFYYVYREKTNPVKLNWEYIQHYSDLYSEYQQSKKEIDMKYTAKRKELAEIESTLVKVEKTDFKRSPWTDLVLSKIPNGEFKNEDIYVFVNEFREVYPGNQHPEAKIRQQLQVLRDLGVIEWVSEGLWRKK
jgi:HKD family nuclease